MNKESIEEFLVCNGLSEVEKLDYKDEKFLLFKCLYEFDEDEIDAAKAYADDECEEKDIDIWRKKYIISYLKELAIDTVEELIEEIEEKLQLKWKLVFLCMDEENMEFSKFLIVFNKYYNEINIQQILKYLHL